MKIKKRTEAITIRLEEKLKQEILKFAFENNLTITDVLLKGFDLLKSKRGDIDDKIL